MTFPPLLHGTPEKKLEEYSVEEAEVLQILTQVNVTRRECEIVSVECGVSVRELGGVLRP